MSFRWIDPEDAAFVGPCREALKLKSGAWELCHQERMGALERAQRAEFLLALVAQAAMNSTSAADMRQMFVNVFSEKLERRTLALEAAEQALSSFKAEARELCRWWNAERVAHPWDAAEIFLSHLSETEKQG